MSVARRDAEAAPQSALFMQVLDDHALVGVEVGLDENPERRDVGVDGSCVADDLEQGGDS